MSKIAIAVATAHFAVLSALLSPAMWADTAPVSAGGSAPMHTAMHEHTPAAKPAEASATASASKPERVVTAAVDAGAPKITIGNFVFSPQNLEVKAGTSLTFINQDDVPHTVFGSDKDSPLRSAAMDTDDKYSVTLTQPGTYHYFCSLHPHMTGIIVVK